MADITATIRTHLASKSGVTDLIQATGGAFRMFPDVLPQYDPDSRTKSKRQPLVLPACTIDSLGADDPTHNTGAAGVVTETLVSDCYAATRAAANSLRLAIRAELNAFRGTVSSVWIFWVQTRDQSTTFEQSKVGESLKTRYISPIEADVIYQEATTSTPT